MHKSNRLSCRAAHRGCRNVPSLAFAILRVVVLPMTVTLETELFDQGLSVLVLASPVYSNFLFKVHGICHSANPHVNPPINNNNNIRKGSQNGLKWLIKIVSGSGSVSCHCHLRNAQTTAFRRLHPTATAQHVERSVRGGIGVFDRLEEIRRRGHAL